LNRIYFHGVECDHSLCVEDGQKIGSADDCEQFIDNKSLSAHHCMVYFKRGNIFVEPHNNLKLTSLNGLKLSAGQRYVIRPGDELKLGELSFVVSMSAEFSEHMPEIRGFEFDDELTLGGLRLESGEDTQESVHKTKLKKTRKVILELQNAKKQLDNKELELVDLKRKHNDILIELQEVEQFVGDYRAHSPNQVVSVVEKLEEDIGLLDDQIEQNRRVLKDLENKRKEMVDALNSKQSLMHKISQLNDLQNKQAHLHHAIVVIEKIDFKDKREKIEKAIAEEQQRYKEMHQDSAFSLNKKFSRYG
jgi:hypothetical protein